MTKECVIIAGGPSLQDVDLGKLNDIDVDKIVCNKAIVDIPSAKYFITMDYSFLDKLGQVKEKVFSTNMPKIFVANLAMEYMTEEGGSIYDTRKNGKTYDLKRFSCCN